MSTVALRILPTIYLKLDNRQAGGRELGAHVVQTDFIAVATKHIAANKNRKQALEDVGWAILNSKEFLFQH